MKDYKKLAYQASENAMQYFSNKNILSKCDLCDDGTYLVRRNEVDKKRLFALAGRIGWDYIYPSRDNLTIRITTINGEPYRFSVAE